MLLFPVLFFSMVKCPYLPCYSCISCPAYKGQCEWPVCVLSYFIALCYNTEGGRGYGVVKGAKYCA